MRACARRTGLEGHEGKHSVPRRTVRSSAHPARRACHTAAGTALATNNLCFGRIIGANDRLSLGHIGIGDRGQDLHRVIALLRDRQNVAVRCVSVGGRVVHLRVPVMHSAYPLLEYILSLQTRPARAQRSARTLWRNSVSEVSG